MLGDKEQAQFVQRETSEINHLLNEFPASTSILVVDSNFVTLLDMKKIMRQYGYEVTLYGDAEEALAFLKNCKHNINIVVWDFHMPKINGLQAIKIIDSELDLPVVIMSDDYETESVMGAMIQGACYYVTKPVGEEIIPNIWQHIVRRRVTRRGLIQPNQSDLVQNDSSKTVDQENSEQISLNEEEKAAEEPPMTWTGETQQVQSDIVQISGLDQDYSDSKTVAQDNAEENVDKKEGKKTRRTRMTWVGNLHQKFLEAIEIVGGIEKANPKVLLKCLQDMKIEGVTRTNVASHLQKHRINLEEGRIPKKTPEIDRSTAYRPSSHLGSTNVDVTAYRPSSHPGSTNVDVTAYRPSSLLGSTSVDKTAYRTSSLLNPIANNVDMASVSSYHMDGQTLSQIQQNPYPNGYLTMKNNQFMTLNPIEQNPYPNGYLTMKNSQSMTLNPIEQNPYPNGYLTMNNNQLMTNHLPPLPRFDHGHLQQQHHQQQQEQHQQQEQQQQQYGQLSHQLNYVMDKKEPQQAYATDVTNLEPIYPNSPYNPNDYINQIMHF